MDWNCPESSDFFTITAINTAYLALLRRQPTSAHSGEILERLARLSRQQRQRLAATPMLLLSIGERDAGKWLALLDEPDGNDLFSAKESASIEVAFLGVAVAAFAWQLAQRDVHALRLLLGASRQWCSEIAAARYLDVVDVMRRHPELVEPREPENRPFWDKLLGAALSVERDVRRAARLSALQSLLTRPQAARIAAAWPAAAAAARQPKLRVAEQRALRPRRRKPR